MRKKALRSLLCGFLIGSCGMYWWQVESQDSVDVVLDWLQQEADAYRETHDVPTVDTGW